jgi:DNA polymerase III delta prime subunit
MPQDPYQDQHIQGSSIEESQVQLGQAEGDVVQIQGSGNRVIIHRSEHNTAKTRRPLSRQDYRNRQILLNKVRNSWVKGVLENSLYKRVKLELGLEERWDALDLDYATPEQPRQPLPKGTRALDKFDELGAGCTLLILGEPGAGKTTTLLELARDLIARAEQDGTLPIPTVFNLSSWSNFCKEQEEKKKDSTLKSWLAKDKEGSLPTLESWLTDELKTKYQVSETSVQTWLENQDLLLLLDGLDEIPVDYQDACVQAINNFHQEHGLTEIVVCSRIQDYENLANRLRFQGAIFIQPLKTKQVEAYLDNVNDDLGGVKTAWATDPVLQELTQTPLMLSVMVLAYAGMSFEEISQMSLKERQNHLWNRYIEKMLRLRAGNSFYSKEDVVHWLHCLASNMANSGFAIPDLNKKWLTEADKIMSYQILSRLIQILVFSMLLFLFAQSYSLLVMFGWGKGMALGMVALSLSTPSIIMWLNNDTYKVDRFDSEEGSYLPFSLTSESIKWIVNVVQDPDKFKHKLAEFADSFKVEANQFIKILKRKFHFICLFTSMIGIYLFISLVEVSDPQMLQQIPLQVVAVAIVLMAILILLTSSIKSICRFRKEPLHSIFLIFTVLFFLYLLVLHPIAMIATMLNTILLLFIAASTLMLCTLISDGIFSTLNILLNVFQKRVLAYNFEWFLVKRLLPYLLFLIATLLSLMIFDLMFHNIELFTGVSIDANSDSKYELGLTYAVCRGGLLAVGLSLLMVIVLSVGTSGMTLAFIKYHATFFCLRVVLCMERTTPWNYTRFLDWCCDRLLLQKVGQEYMFVHHSLMEHFAQIEESKQ